MTEEQKKPRLLIVVGSVRDGRVGKIVSDWVADQARDHGWFDVVVADLKELNLPLMTEPNHPSMKQYTQDKTWEWSAMVDGADAFLFVTPEYNHGTNAALINALDYLVQEWAYKPAGIVSYGGISGGLRSSMDLKLKLVSFNMMPIKDQVQIVNVSNHADKQTGRFTPMDAHESSMKTMLDALVQWEKAMHQLRVSPSS